MEWNQLQGYLGLRKAEEARLAEFWPDDYEQIDMGTPWEPMTLLCEAKTRWVDIEDAAVVPASYMEEDILQYYHREIILRCKAFQKEISAKMFRVGSMEELYALIDKVNEWDKQLPRDIVPSWDFLERAFIRAEARVRRLIRKLRDRIFTWMKRNQERIVQLGTSKGFLFSFSGREQFKIARVAVLEGG